MDLEASMMGLPMVQVSIDSTRSTETSCRIDFNAGWMTLAGAHRMIIRSELAEQWSQIMHYDLAGRRRIPHEFPFYDPGFLVRLT